FAGGPYSLLDHKSTSMNASFAPTDGGGPIGLADAATACGFTGFNWQQQVDSLPAPSGLFPVNRSALNPKNLSSLDGSLQAPPIFVEPPPGGYIGIDEGDDAYPFYWGSNELTDYSGPLPCPNVGTVDNPSYPKACVPCTGETAILSANKLSFQDCPALRN